MKNKNLTVCFFGAYDRGFTSNKIIMDGLVQNGVRIVEINSNVKLTRLDRDEDMSMWKLCLRVLKKWRVTVEVIRNVKGLRASQVIYVGFPGHFDVIPAYIIAKIFRKKLIFNPLVIFYTGYVDDQGILKESSFLGKIIKFGEKLIYRLSDVVIADTPLQKDHLEESFDVPARKLDVLPIGADDKVYPFKPHKSGKIIDVVYYGLYTPLHGVEHIVEAARILRDEKNIVFTMVGKGHTFEENYKRAQELKLTNMKFFPDMMEDTALQTLQKGDIFLGFLQKHPTVDRVVPNKVYQGIALGKAVISADSKVIRSVFTHGENVYLCEAASGESLAKAVLTLRDDQSLREKIATNGYKLYKNNFTPSMVGKELVRIIEAIV